MGRLARHKVVEHFPRRKLKEQIMNEFLSIGSVIAGASAVVGQTDGAGAHERAACAMTLAQSPETVGLKLGMSAEQVLALFPGSREDVDVRSSLSRPASPLGVSSFIIVPERYASKDNFRGITQIAVMLLDGQVSTLNVGYKGPEWSHVDEFVEFFAERKKLPAVSAWETRVGMDNQLKTLRCKEFEVELFAGGKNVHNINHVVIRDMLAQQKLKERRAKARLAEESKP
jgi:hypothetical protein